MRKLNELSIGEEAVVRKIPKGKRRLRDMGLIEGTRISCVLRSPLGDPTAYEVRGALIAIRKEDSESIYVEVRGDE